MNIGHTSMPQGARVIVFVRHGKPLHGIYKQHHSKSVELQDGRKIPISDIRTISYDKTHGKLAE